MNFDDIPPQPHPKSRFIPKGKTRKLRPVAPKREPDDDDAALDILKRFQEIGRSRKLESSSSKDSLADAVKSSELVSSAPSSYGTDTTENHGLDKTGYSGGGGGSYALRSKVSKSDGKQKALCLRSPDISPDDVVYSEPARAVSKKVKKDYVEPWDYTTYYPTSLPLRKPYSGCPEILDAEEFGENQIVEPDESVENLASELGLLASEACEETELFLVQLPQKLPITKELSGAKRPSFSGSSASNASSSGSGKQIVISPSTGSASVPGPARNLPKSQAISLPTGSTTLLGPARNLPKSLASRPVHDPTQTNCFEGLPAGHLGKMLVYKSGKVKWKMGENVFDVAPGIHFDSMAQDAVAMNAEERTCCEIKKLEKKMTVTPDVDFLLDSIL
uniref:Uncharacterized protein n=1 Tax=Kalanchoe fedtschenkoi TaxID=63787 RepID=A0A7N1A039_KALFE